MASDKDIIMAEVTSFEVATDSATAASVIAASIAAAAAAEVAAAQVTAADTSTASSTTARQGGLKEQKNLELYVGTISKPAHAYARLELAGQEVEEMMIGGGHHKVGTEPAATTTTLDALQVRSYCAAALKRFLGVLGAAIPVDVLKVQGGECWVRLPREDFSRFAAAMTAWPGTGGGGGEAPDMLLRIGASGNWLGSLLARGEQSKLWNS